MLRVVFFLAFLCQLTFAKELQNADAILSDWQYYGEVTQGSKIRKIWRREGVVWIDRKDALSVVNWETFNTVYLYGKVNLGEVKVEVYSRNGKLIQTFTGLYGRI